MFQRFPLPGLLKIQPEPRRFIQVLIGPGQVGKTTLILQMTDQINLPCHFVSADAVAATNTSRLEQQWETARIKMDAANASEFLLVIDEIQKIPDWNETVKLLWDTDTHSARNL